MDEPCSFWEGYDCSLDVVESYFEGDQTHVDELLANCPSTCGVSPCPPDRFWNIHRESITCPELKKFQFDISRPSFPDTFQLDEQCGLTEFLLPDIQIIAPVLLQLKSQSSILKDVWHNLTPDTKDADVEGLALDGVTIVDGMMTEIRQSGIGLTGSIPDFSKNVMLRVVDLSHQCSKKVYADYTALTGGLTGEIPDFSKNTALQQLLLQTNKLTGNIGNFSNNVNLGYLNLAQNGLTGTIPDFSKNTALGYLDISNNQCTGTTEWKADTSNYPSGCAVEV